MKPVAGVLDGVTNITTGIANTPDALMQKTVIPVQRRRLPRTLQKHEKLKEYKKKQALGSLIVWHMEQQGLDGRQLGGLSSAEIIDLREREKIMFQQIINDGQKLVCGTNYRFFSVNILKTEQISEWDKDSKELTQVHSIWKATFGIKNTKNPNEEKDVTKVKAAFKKTATLHTLPIKQFQPMHSPQTFGDPAPGRKKVLTITYTSTKITEKSALGSLFDDMVGTVTTIGSSEATKTHDGFDCLLSSRVVASVKAEDEIIKITYYQYHTPSAITNLKSYNMKRINRNAKTKQVEIVCSSKSEADKLQRKIKKYIDTVNPEVERATLGYATKKDVTKRLQQMINDRNLCTLQVTSKDGTGNDIGHHLGSKKDENELKLKYTQTLTVTYKTKQGISRTKMFEDGGQSVELE